MDISASKEPPSFLVESLVSMAKQILIESGTLRYIHVYIVYLFSLNIINYSF